MKKRKIIRQTLDILVKIVGAFFIVLLLFLISETINDKVVDQLLNIVSVAIVLIFTGLGLWLTQKYKLGILPVVFPTVPLIFTVYKNSLQSRGNDSRIFKYLSRSERNINR